MQSQNRLFDDFVKVMNGAAGTIAGMTREAQAAMQERATRMDRRARPRLPRGIRGGEGDGGRRARGE